MKTRALCFALLAGVFGGFPLLLQAQEVNPPLERALYRDVSGRVLDGETGNPLAGVPVSLLYETTTTDEAGRFTFEKVPLRHTAEVSIRVKSESGFIIGCITLDVPVRFFPIAAVGDGRVAVEVVEPGADEAVELRLAKIADDEVDQFCEACHGSNPCLETATYEEVIKSGADLRGIIVEESQVEAFKAGLQQKGLRRETYQGLRYQDTHPDKMNMVVIPTLALVEYKGKFKTPENLFLQDGKFVTCDTCHTRHMPTDQKQYVVMPYAEDNSLCFECHL